MTLLKVCGMRGEDHIMELGEVVCPDLMGFIFYKKSRRYVGEDFRLPDHFSKDIQKVGVFVNESQEKVIELSKKHDLDWVQLHGLESPEYCQSIRNAGRKVVKVIHIGEQSDVRKALQYQDSADRIMFETASKEWGGSGAIFNWEVLSEYRGIPYWLSGGIGPDRVQAIHEISGQSPEVIDVNSRFEISPGVKDIEVLKEFKLKLKSINHGEII